MMPTTTAGHRGVVTVTMYESVDYMKRGIEYWLEFLWDALTQMKYASTADIIR